MYTDRRGLHTPPTWLYGLLWYKEIIEHCQWVRLIPSATRTPSNSPGGSSVGLGDHRLDTSFLCSNG